MEAFFKKNEFFLSFSIYKTYAFGLMQLVFWRFYFGLVFFSMWCECNYSCSGDCNAVPVEVPVSSFPATPAARVHGVFSYLSLQTGVAMTTGKSSGLGHFGEGNFGGVAESQGKAAEHRGGVCSVLRWLPGEGLPSK